MKKLMVSLFAVAALASSAMAAEPLTKAQLDQVTAGGFKIVKVQANVAVVKQVAVAKAGNKCKVAICVNKGAVAQNVANIGQVNSN